jgi:hypothetical protein
MQYLVPGVLWSLFLLYIILPPFNINLDTHTITMYLVYLLKYFTMKHVYYGLANRSYRGTRSFLESLEQRGCRLCGPALLWS